MEDSKAIKDAGLNALAAFVHHQSSMRGFYEEKHEFGTNLMLITSELAEALEADRLGDHASIENFEKCIKRSHIEDREWESAFNAFMKDTVEDELADTIIRLLDLIGYLGIDIDKHIYYKMVYNSERPRKNGKLY